MTRHAAFTRRWFLKLGMSERKSHSCSVRPSTEDRSMLARRQRHAGPVELQQRAQSVLLLLDQRVGPVAIERPAFVDIWAVQNPILEPAPRTQHTEPGTQNPERFLGCDGDRRAGRRARVAVVQEQPELVVPAAAGIVTVQST